MSDPFDLDGLRMNAVETAPNGAINADTIFRFEQTGARVHAEYAGGRVELGHLVGLVRGATFAFRYCQLHDDGTLHGGQSNCELRRADDGRLQIIEHFEWDDGPGTNVIQELR